MINFNANHPQPQLAAAFSVLLNVGSQMADIFGDWKDNPGSILTKEECARMSELQKQWLDAMTLVKRS